MSLPTIKREAAYVVDAARDAGINYFDTADLYARGVNEEIIGDLLKSQRHEFILATKVGNRWQEGQNGWTWDTSATYIKRAVKDSLHRLQTDYIDIYQLHGGTQDDNWPEIIATFDELKQEGLIREYGISSIRPNVFVPFAEQSQAVSNMMQFNLLDQCASEWFDGLEAHGLSVVTRGSIAKGLLTAEWRTRLKDDYMNYSNEELKTALTTIEQRYSNLHAAALAFNLSYSAVASTVIGARTKEQLEQNLHAYEKAQQLETIQEILKMTKQDRYMVNR